MKKVIFQKRKFSLKDIVRIIIIILMHYLGFYLAFGVLFITHYFIFKNFLPEIKPMFWGIIYGCFISPFVNATLHIIYSEAGSPWTRGAMWLHSLFSFFIVLIALFL